MLRRPNTVTLDRDRIYQLKITLRGIEPPIWRRVQVPGSMTLPRLHRVFQVAMGWTDSHLHEFTIGGRRYGQPDPEWPEQDVLPERSVRLGEVVLEPGARFTYLYDFGDSWEHEGRVEKILPPEPGTHYPRCLAGARSCPPEDCGGVSGYEEFLAAIRDPDHPEHGQMLTWAGGRFDPEAFDPDAVNRRLRRFRSPGPAGPIGSRVVGRGQRPHPRGAVTAHGITAKGDRDDRGRSLPDALERYVAELVRRFGPERVILFGSHAEGRATSDSDVDLLVVMAFEGRGRDQAARMDCQLERDFPLDLFVRRPETVTEALRKGDPFMETIVKKGKVLYARPD